MQMRNLQKSLFRHLHSRTLIILVLGLSLAVYIVFRSLVFGVEEIRKTNFREYALVSAGMLRVCWHPPVYLASLCP